MKLSHHVHEQLDSLVASEGLQLLDVETSGSGAKAILRLVVDGPGGVTLGQCAHVSRQASALLDVEDPVGHRYTLEVSSPGLERKLYTAGDYHRFSGQRVKIRMRPEYREIRTAVGKLAGLKDGVVTVLLDGGELAELPLDEVFETRLQVDWDALMNERKNR